MFSPSTLRHYDSTTPHLTIYIVILYFLQRHCDTTTVQHYPLLLYSKSIFSPGHCDTTTLRHPLLYIVNLYFLQRHCDTTTVRHHPLRYIVNLYLRVLGSWSTISISFLTEKHSTSLMAQAPYKAISTLYLILLPIHKDTWPQQHY